MNFLDQLHEDIKTGRKIGRERIEKEQAKKVFKPPKRPRTPNRYLIEIGVALERMAPFLEMLHEMVRYLKRDLRKVIRYAKVRKTGR